MAVRTSNVKTRASAKLRDARERAGGAVARTNDAVNRSTSALAPTQKAVSRKAGPVVRRGTDKAKSYRWQVVALGTVLIALLVAVRLRKSGRGQGS